VHQAAALAMFLCAQESVRPEPGFGVFPLTIVCGEVNNSIPATDKKPELFLDPSIEPLILFPKTSFSSGLPFLTFTAPSRNLKIEVAFSCPFESIASQPN
jgi:hypothetical protein